MADQDPSPAEMRSRMGLGIGLVLGMGVGAAVGRVLDNRGLGITLGLSVGLAFSLAFSVRRRKGAGGREGVQEEYGESEMLQGDEPSDR